MKGIVSLFLAGVVAAAGVGCASQLSSSQSASQLNSSTSPQNSLDDSLVVDCRFPPRVRTTSGRVIQIPRSTEKKTQLDCIKEGGQPISAQRVESADKAG